MRISGVFLCAFLAATAFGQEAIPKGGLVPDSTTAVKIAETVLIPIYGQQKIESQKPFSAKLKDDVWTVSGTLYCSEAQSHREITLSHCNGILEVLLSKSDARILKIFPHN